MAQSSEQWHWARSEVAPAQNLGSYRNRVNRSHFSTLDLSLTGTRGKQGWQKKKKEKKKNGVPGLPCPPANGHINMHCLHILVGA